MKLYKKNKNKKNYKKKKIREKSIDIFHICNVRPICVCVHVYIMFNWREKKGIKCLVFLDHFMF